MNEVIEKYKLSKHEECITLLEKQIKENGTLIDNLIKQNCLNVCQCVVSIKNEDLSSAAVQQRQLYKTYQNAIALSPPGELVPIHLELTLFLNFVWWSLHCLNFTDTFSNNRLCLPFIQKGLRRVLGISCKVNNYSNLSLDILCDLKNGKNLLVKDTNTVPLLLDLIIHILLFILIIDNSSDIMEQVIQTAQSVSQDMEILMSQALVNMDLERQSNIDNSVLFKFEYTKKTCDTLYKCSISNLHIIQCVCLYLMKNYDKVLQIMKKNVNSLVKPLWCYLCGLSSFMMEDLGQCLGFVSAATELKMSEGLRCRLAILHGLLLSRKEDHKGALKCFDDALKMCPSNAVINYYMGEEYGKIGLYDDMVENFLAVVKVKNGQKVQKKKFYLNFESVVLDLIHPDDEISEAEALYAAAVACGLNDRFQQSSEMFAEYLEKYTTKESERRDGDRIIKSPSIVTILNEAATMNILSGNFTQSEHLVSCASNHYVKLDTPIHPTQHVNVTKDLNWIRNLLDEELGINPTRREDGEECVQLFSEDMAYVFDANVIGELLLCEMERIQEVDTYKVTLGKLYSIFSKYSEKKLEDEPSTILVKALWAKVCLQIAQYQMKCKSCSEIERSFKRALSCNQGDKDVLHQYCRFLIGMGKLDDARKLWKSFRDKQSRISVDQCQSLALRYLLRSNVTRRDLEKLESDVEALPVDILKR